MIWLIVVFFLHGLLLSHPGIPNPNHVPVGGPLRRSSAPFLSGDTFRSFCNHIFDETNHVFQPSKVKKGDIIFVRNDVLELFFSQYHDRIVNPYIIVTHNNIHRVPGKYVSYLDDEKIIAWFGHNVDKTTHPKFYPIPLGLANYSWPHGRFEHLSRLQKKVRSFRSGIKTYVNFRLHTNKTRALVWNHFKDKSFSVVKTNRSHNNYLEDMCETTFVISPPGAGLDCHRNWEALYLSCIPIMEHSSLDPVFDDLPVILVDNWQEITEEFLEYQLKEINQKVFNYEKLYAHYWQNLIKSVQKKFLDL